MDNCGRINCGGGDAMEPRMDMEQRVVDGFPLAMAYVPYQAFQRIYPLDKALEAGTIFEELHQPFCGRRNGGQGR
jgi:hypothetical protein